MGVPPIAGWFLVENPDRKWMMTGDIPYFRKPPYDDMGYLSPKTWDDMGIMGIYPQE